MTRWRATGQFISRGPVNIVTMGSRCFLRPMTRQARSRVGLGSDNITHFFSGIVGVPRRTPRVMAGGAEARMKIENSRPSRDGMAGNAAGTWICLSEIRSLLSHSMGDAVAAKIGTMTVGALATDITVYSAWSSAALK